MESKLRQHLNEGCIAAFYTLSGYFVKVYPVTNIDKVRFSFVEKGKKGSGFDIYVDIDKFLLLTEEIIKGTFQRRLQEDNGDYPQAWTYVTGENGSKNLAIGKGKKSIVIQGRVKGEKPKNAFVPVTGYNDLLTMAQMFQIVTGYKPVSGYWDELKAVFERGMKESEKYRSKLTPQDEPQAVPEAATEEHVEKVAEEVQDGFGTFVATGMNDLPSGNGFYIDMTDKENQEDHMVFAGESLKNPRVSQFRDITARQKATRFTARYVVKKGRKFFKEFA